jgi:hypothetical protein
MEKRKVSDLLALREALQGDSRLAPWAKCEERNFFARTVFFPSVPASMHTNYWP